MTYSENVCADCFDDANVRSKIIESNGELGCSFCDQSDSPTMPLYEVCKILLVGVETMFSRAVDDLPYDNESDSGFFGSTYSTSEVLFEYLQLRLPRDSYNKLENAILHELGDENEPWCDYNTATLDLDESILLDWARFSEIVKYERRFFFHNRGEEAEWIDDTRSPRQLLQIIANLVDTRNLIRLIDYDTLFRVRRHVNTAPLTTAKELGPPPSTKALQSNRMNPPGVSMFYGAECSVLAIVEAGAEENEQVSIGSYQSCAALRILDLVKLPSVPGAFSGAARDDILALRFLHAFTELIIAPVQRTNETVLEYIPTQVFTEFLRDYKFSGGLIDGIRYPSSTGVRGANVVLFVGSDQVADIGSATGDCKLQFLSASEVTRDANAVGTLYDMLRAVWGTPLFNLVDPPELPGSRVSDDQNTQALALEIAQADDSGIGYAYEVDSTRLGDFTKKVAELGLREQDLDDS